MSLWSSQSLLDRGQYIAALALSLPHHTFQFGAVGPEPAAALAGLARAAGCLLRPGAGFPDLFLEVADRVARVFCLAVLGVGQPVARRLGLGGRDVPGDLGQRPVLQLIAKFAVVALVEGVPHAGEVISLTPAQPEAAARRFPGPLAVDTALLA